MFYKIEAIEEFPLKGDAKYPKSKDLSKIGDNLLGYK